MPAGQATQAEEAASEIVPGIQIEQLNAPASENLTLIKKYVIIIEWFNEDTSQRGKDHSSFL